MEKYLIEKIVLQKKPLSKYGFEYKKNDNGVDPVGDEFIEFDSNVFHSRKIGIKVYYLKRNDICFYHIQCKIEKITDKVVEGEDVSLYILSFLNEKMIEYTKDKFLIYFENSIDLENKINASFDYLETLFDTNEELNKIIKGEYWEYRTTNWNMFGGHK